MPQWRKLHVRATESLDINDMPDDFTRLLWVMMPLCLDREGRGLDNPAWVKAKIMPLRIDVSVEQVGAALDWFAARGMSRRYGSNGRAYFYLPTFPTYQGDTSREAVSNYPPPDEADGNYSPLPDLLSTSSRPTQEPVVNRSRSEAEADADADQDSDAEAATATDADRLPGAVAAILSDFGIGEPLLSEAAKRVTPLEAKAWVMFASLETGLKNPPAFVGKQIVKGKKPPADFLTLAGVSAEDWAWLEHNSEMAGKTYLVNCPETPESLPPEAIDLFKTYYAQTA